MQGDQISVIIPFFRAGIFVKQLVATLSGQTDLFFEVVIVDDGKGSGFDQLLAEIECSAISGKTKFVSTLGCQGPAVARNLGLTIASGRFVAFLDCDDEWDPQYLAVMRTRIRSEDVGMAVCEVHFKTGSKRTRLRLPEMLTLADMLQTNPISVPAVFVDRCKVGEVRFPDRGHEDYALWLELASTLPRIHCVQFPLVTINRVPGSLSSRKAKSASWHWRILASRPELNFFTRALLFLLYCLNGVLKRTQRNYKPVFLPGLAKPRRT